MALAAALLAGLCVYAPALRGPFVFDDFGLPQARMAAEPLRAWLAGVRPVLMFTYWLNHTVLGDAPSGYHAVNLLIHVVNTSLVFLILVRLLTMTGWLRLQVIVGSSVGALVFLIHPLQTESVSYIAGRSESLAALFSLCALCLFLYRRNESISWLEASIVLVLFGLGIAVKENTVSLAGILVLTDLFWPRPFSTANLRKNWRLYLLMAPGAMVAAAGIFRMLAHAPSAGFSLRTFTWYQYSFTEARAIFTYLRLAVLPLQLSVDHDFPASRTITQHGAFFYILLLAVLVAAAIAFRRRYRLACFGLLMFLIWLAPTSSIVPINDALVERRMYLPMLGLILIGCEAAARLRLSRPATYGALTAMVILFGELCYERNQLWAQPEALFASAAMQSTHNSRPLASLADLLIADNRCGAALPYLEQADRLFPKDYWVQLSWGRILECLERRDEAMKRLQLAASIEPTSKVFELIGLLYAEMHMTGPADQALQKAIQIDPRSVTAHKARAAFYESIHNLEAAESEYRTSVTLDRSDSTAQFSLVRVHQMLAAQRSD
jgi:tetratricopeptide (TPR) repeat protein